LCFPNQMIAELCHITGNDDQLKTQFIDTWEHHWFPKLSVAIRIAWSLCKYDHVSHHMKSLSWLLIVYLIQYRSNCAMYHNYTNNFIPLFPPVTSGHKHERDTHHPVHFANLPRCRLSSTQHFFRTKGAKWWNLLPSDVISLGYSTFSSVVYDSLMRQYDL